MKARLGNERTNTKEGLDARWVEHFTELFNQPGELGDGIELCLLVQQLSNITGPFDISELRKARRDMGNDKAAGFIGRLRDRSREVYCRRAVYGNGTGNIMFNDILQSGDMPEIMRYYHNGAIQR